MKNVKTGKQKTQTSWRFDELYLEAKAELATMTEQCERLVRENHRMNDLLLDLENRPKIKQSQELERLEQLQSVARKEIERIRSDVSVAKKLMESLTLTIERL